MISISLLKYRANCVNIRFSDEAINIIGTKEIVFKEKKGTIIIKKPSFDTNKFYLLRRHMQIAVQNTYALVGNYTIEQDDEQFILTKI